MIDSHTLNNAFPGLVAAAVAIGGLIAAKIFLHLNQRRPCPNCRAQTRMHREATVVDEIKSYFFDCPICGYRWKETFDYRKQDQ